MTPPIGDRPAATRSTVSEDQSFGARANSRAAAAALEAIGRYARAEGMASDVLPLAIRRSRAEDHARLARTLCALRHLADEVGGLSFGDALRAANEQYQDQYAGFGPHAMVVPNPRMAGEAVGTCERSLTAPRPRHRGSWPPDTLSYLHGYASSHGLSFEAAVTSLTIRLLADLRHYANRQDIDFQQALTAGMREHAQMRLRAEGPFQTGQNPGHLPAQASLMPVTASFEPTATSQGVVVSSADAEWLLIRTAARNQDRWQHGLPADRRDADDERVLTDALAGACGQAPEEIHVGLAPQIAARVMQIEDGPAAAAGLGREHGRAGTPPYCDLEADGDATALLHALGETEPMTNGNHPFRVSLVTAYARAFRQAAEHDPPAAGSPARIAARDFPRMSPAAGTPSAPDHGHRTRATRQAPRRGPLPGAQ